MKLTVGSHPAIPEPFSNGPEEPPPTPRGLAEPLRVASQRHDHGVATMAALLNHWLGSSKLSHDQLVAVASWGLNERGMIDGAVISRARNGKQVRGLSWRHLDALSAANRAIWLWQTKGQDGAWKVLGPHGGWGVREEWLNDATWLPHPEYGSEPMTFGDLAEVLAGYQDVPYLTTPLLSPGEARQMSDRVVQLLEGSATERGWGPREAVRQMVAAYPVTDRARQQRLRGLIVGEQTLARGDLELELHALAEMIRATRGLRPGSYGPAELRRELSSVRPGGRG